MTRHIEDDLNAFHDDLLKMASLAEQAIDKSIKALKTRDKDLAKEVVASDEAIDEMEIKIETQAIDLLALHQPMAIDLRMITTGMEINSELERIADMAVNIAYKVIDIADTPLVKQLIDIPKLSEMARKMVRGAIDAFVKHDQELAKEVILADEKSDELRNKIMKELIYDYLVKDGSLAPRVIPLLLIARDLERMCDHATSIAEDVIYMIEAKMVRHHPEKLDGEEGTES